MNWQIPLGDKVTVSAIEREWKQKHEYALNLCKNKNVVVQAGGNLGIFPYYLSEHFEKVITFEPIEKNLNCLYKNIESKDNIAVIEMALGDSENKVKIKKEVPGNCGAIQLEYSENAEIKTTLLDRIPLQNLDLLWLDVEGFELKAIIGSLISIHRFKPIIILENNGLIPEYPADLDGSEEFRNFICRSLGYKYINRIMRDDFFVPL